MVPAPPGSGSIDLSVLDPRPHVGSLGSGLHHVSSKAIDVGGSSLHSVSSHVLDVGGAIGDGVLGGAGAVVDFINPFRSSNPNLPPLLLNY